MLLEAAPWQPPPWAHGCLPARRRENAIMGARIVIDRLRAIKLGFVASSKDAANAFGSTRKDEIDDFIDERLGENMAAINFFHQRRDNSVLEIEGSDATLVARTGSGGMMGDGNAPEEFMGVFHRSLADWQRRIYQESRALVVQCAIFNRPIDARIFAFVDDILKILIANNAKEAQKKHQEQNKTMKEALGERDFHLNDAKQENICYFSARTENRRIHEKGALEGRTLMYMKYLGEQLPPSNNNAPGRKARETACNKGLYANAFLAQPGPAKSQAPRVYLPCAICRAQRHGGMLPHGLRRAGA